MVSVSRQNYLSRLSILEQARHRRPHPKIGETKFLHEIFDFSQIIRQQFSSLAFIIFTHQPEIKDPTLEFLLLSEVHDTWVRYMNNLNTRYQ